MTYEHLILETREQVATITLNRPDAYNALDLGLGRELFHAVLEVDEDPGVRCVVITGAGRAFCAGGDVKDFADNLPRIGILVKELTTYLHGAVSRLPQRQAGDHGRQRRGRGRGIQLRPRPATSSWPPSPRGSRWPTRRSRPRPTARRRTSCRA